jgi:hypothetical protein
VSQGLEELSAISYQLTADSYRLTADSFVPFASFAVLLNIARLQVSSP